MMAKLREKKKGEGPNYLYIKSFNPPPPFLFSMGKSGRGGGGGGRSGAKIENIPSHHGSGSGPEK